MSRALSLIAPTTGYASPNQLVTAQLATNVGFNPNDYVYAYGNNQVGNLGSTIGVGLTSTYIAGTRINGAVQTGFTPTSVMSGPYSASATYTGTTRTIYNIFQAATEFSTNAAANIQSCVLNNGNVAIAFRDSTANNLKISIFTNAGVSVKAATTVSSLTSAGVNALAVSAMVDGGFVIVYSASSQNYYQRFDSAGTSTTGEVVLLSNLAGTTAILNIAGGINGGFAIVGSASSSQAYVSSYNSSNSHLGQLTLTSATAVTASGIVGLTNGNYAIGWSQSGNTLWRSIIDPTPSVVVSASTVVSMQNDNISIAAYDGGFLMTTKNSSSGNLQLASISNLGVLYNGSISNGFGNSMLSSVCVDALNNVAYVVFQSFSNSLWYVAKYNNINSSAAVFDSNNNISGLSPSNGQIKNAFNALNGSIYYVYYGTSSRPTFTTINIATYTQNTTTLTNTGFYTPTNGYYLLGIGATTAAAGSSGLIYTNGGITLPSTYPSVSTGYAFDYQSNSYWAQRGTINGRTINLQGAQ